MLKSSKTRSICELAVTDAGIGRCIGEQSGAVVGGDDAVEVSGERVGGLQAPHPVESDAIAALVKLGYSQMMAADAIARASQAIGPNADALPLDALIRESLRQLAR